MRRMYRKQILELRLGGQLLADIYGYVMSNGRKCYCECSCDTIQLKAISDRLKEIKPGFADFLISLIDRKGMKDSDVYNRAGLTKQTFNKIKNKKAMPKKETAMSLCIGARLSFDEAEELLNRAGYAFSESSKEDMVFLYFIEHKQYNIMQVYSALYEFGIKESA